MADRSGPATSYAMTKLQERGDMFVEPTNEVYEGLIVGEHSRPDDLDVNIAQGEEPHQRSLLHLGATSRR